MRRPPPLPPPPPRSVCLFLNYSPKLHSSTLELITSHFSSVAPTVL